MTIRLRILDDKCDPYFLSYFLSSNIYFDQIRLVIKHAIGQSSINQEDIDNLELGLPPLKEQKKIASIMSSVETKIENGIKQRNISNSLKKALMQKLLTGKIRVKV